MVDEDSLLRSAYHGPVTWRETTLSNETGSHGLLTDFRSDRYELIELIGTGAMGLVFRAYDRVAGRHVALKSRLHPDPEDLFRLKREFRSLARIAHPNLVRLYEMVAEDDQCFFTMELIVDGLPLPEHLRTRVRPGKSAETGEQAPRRDVALREVFLQLAFALQRLHDAEKIHRDVKPSNVLVDATGRVALLDFGLLGGLGTELSKVSMRDSFVGTLAYMSLEQTQGMELTPAADWYSFGAMLYECLTGHSPFASATPVEMIDRTRVQVPPPESLEPGCSPDLAALAMQLLSNEATDRPGSSEILSVLGSSSRVSASSAAMTQSSVPQSVFVNRHSEFERLSEALEAMKRGEVAAVAIEGLSGIGKTGLIEHFLSVHELDDGLLLRSRCYPYQVVPFEALDEAVDDLSRFLVSQSPERIEALMPRGTAALRKVFPVLARVPQPEHRVEPSLDAAPHELRRQGFLALRELVGRVADRQPVIVWIDDMQWSDADSEPLLRVLLRPPDAPRVLWIFSYRSEERSESPILAGVDELLDLIPDVSRHQLRLGPLSEGDCHELLEALGGETDLTDEASEEITAESGGSPFLLGEMVRHGRSEDGTLRIDFGAALVKRLHEFTLPAQRLVETVVVAAGPLERTLAIEASGLEDFDPDLIANLERERLLRTTTTGGRVALEVYHDRIRETLESQLPPDVIRARHREIAKTLETHASPDVRALFNHLRSADEASAAAPYAVLAGDQAATQLAFDQAAYLYRSALELDPSAIDPFSTLIRLANALANAGRGGESALAFGRASQIASESSRDAEATTLRRQSAEQYVLSGRLEDGTRVLKPLLEDLGVGWPDSTARALRGTLLRLPWLALEYGRFSARDEAEVDEKARLRMDLCLTAAKGLVVVDPIRAAYFSVRGLITALGSGDLWRTGRALSAVGVALMPVAGPISVWANDMLRRSVAIGEETGDPYLRAVASICQAEAFFVKGRWTEMLSRCDRGTEMLRANCRGVRWECDVGDMAALRALEELGRIPELNERLPHLLEEADELDDRYAQVTFHLYQGFWLIAKDEVGRARATAREGLARWDQPVQHLQHLYGLRIEAFCDLYENEPERAWQRVNDTWPEIQKANLLRHPLLRTDAYMLRACTALALAEARSTNSSLLRDAARSARVLARARRPDALAGAALIKSGVARLRGDLSRAVGLLERAEQLYAGADMPLHAAYALRRWGQLIPGEGGTERVKQADFELRERGIRSPERWLALVAPGFGADTPASPP